MTFVFKHPSKYKKAKKLTTTVPPESGPTPQGLNISYNTVKTTTIPENINGNNRQVFTQRGKERNKHS